jgi:hypothetical protein
MTTVELHSREDWRAWLAANHASAEGNGSRVEKLIAAGKMAPAGLAAYDRRQ